MVVKKYIANKLDNLGAVSFSLLGAGTLGQFPQYLAQYLQRLGGHIDEADSIASKYKSQEIGQHAVELKEGLEVITNASPIGKLWQFVRNVDLDIAQRALENYTPGMTFDAQGLTYCAVGAVIGFVGYEVSKGVGSKLFNKRRRPSIWSKPKY